jgi:hypothetical protein
MKITYQNIVRMVHYHKGYKTFRKKDHYELYCQDKTHEGFEQQSSSKEGRESLSRKEGMKYTEKR